MRGKVICFEGIDGTGKTTQAMKLKQHLQEKGYPVAYVKLGQGYLSEQLKEINSGKLGKVFTTRSLLFAAHADYVDKEVVQPAVEAGKIVLLDRQYLTLLVYGTIRNQDRAWIECVNKKLSKPDITLVILTDPDEIVTNRNKKINLFETVRDEIPANPEDFVPHYLRLQREADAFYRSLIDDRSIVGVPTAGGIDATFERVIRLLRSRLHLNL